MRVAVISDVHGNADALAAVLADIKAHAPDITLNLGDCLSGPLQAERTAEMLQSANLTATVRGNHDRYLGNPALMDEYWIEAHTADGTPRRASLETITEKAQGITQSLMLCGHTHVARALRLPDGRLILNPGSVGCPGYTDSGIAGRHVFAASPYASYAILDRTHGAWSITQRTVPYDTRPAIALAKAADYPDWVAALSTGWI
jgi:putative phosphoesterase